MATTKICIHEIGIDKLKDFKNFKLCYVDEVPETFMDYTPESKALMQTKEYKEYIEKRRNWIEEKLKTQHYISGVDYNTADMMFDPDRKFRTEMMDYPTQEFLDGYTHYLYFTNDLDMQWGDDWDDAPYEYNAEVPYDDKTNIIIIPVRLMFSFLTNLDGDNDDYDKLFAKCPNYHYCDLRFPKDWGGINSPFCVDDINGGAVAWIYATLSKTYMKKHIAVHAGENPESVINKIDEINKMLS